MQRADEYAERRAHLEELSDAELHARFWRLVEQVVAPLVAEARTHTSPSIERSVLLRMGFSSLESKALVEQMGRRGLLGLGAGRLVLELVDLRLELGDVMGVRVGARDGGDAELDSTMCRLSRAIIDGDTRSR